jgi:NTE family protein
MTVALVLGGGGIAGIAWHTGVLLGLAEADVDATSADLLVGTSAGSTVAAQLAAGQNLTELFDRQVDPATLATERTPPVAMDELLVKFAPIFSEGHDAAERRRLLGALALATDTVAEAERRAVIVARRVGPEWPDRPLAVTAVDTATGNRRVFDRASGVDLVDAVAASCAVPGVWPPVTVGGVRYMDGGTWSLTNLDVAAGYDRVLVLAPIVDPALAREIDALGPSVSVQVVQPDAHSTAAFGADVLDPAIREPSARAGLAQGRAEVDRIRPLLAG